ncbi:MAG TPA: hypothetical protein VLA46_10270 [Saprospiraceae bacterium]|nr:hypothetical protein [Saprospiraceae bacterium]
MEMDSEDVKEHRLDRTAFKMQTAEQASNTVAYWRQRPDAEKLRAAYHLSLRAWGYDPENEPRLDKTKFSMRKLE